MPNKKKNLSVFEYRGNFVTNIIPPPHLKKALRIVMQVLTFLFLYTSEKYLFIIPIA